MRKLFLLAAVACAGCGRTSAVEEVHVSAPPSDKQADAYQPAQSDWPCWRGPQRNGAVATADSLGWVADAEVVWQAAVPGRGHASPSVVGDLVILSSADEENQKQFMIAFNRQTGEQSWKIVLHETGFPDASEIHQKGTDANATVACDDQHAYVAHLTSKSIVASAVDFDGNLVWQTRLGDFASKFGYAPSPVVYGSTVIFAADNWGGGYLAAVDRKTGEIVWRKKRSFTSTYSSPVVANVAGRDQLLITGDNQVASYDPATGEPLWSCRGGSEATCGTVVWDDQVVYASGGYPGQQTLAVRADGSAEVLWSHRVKVYEPSMVVIGDAIFAANDRGLAYCWDRATGKELWKKRVGGSFSASPIYGGDEILSIKADGKLVVFKASREGYEEVCSRQLGDDAYASPAFAGDQLFVRVGTYDSSDNRQEVLYCLAAPASEATPDATASLD